MAHFYGAITGQAGPATRTGSKRSGYSAWAQNDTGRILIALYHHEERDLASIVIDGSTINYSSGGHFLIGNDLDLSALMRHGHEPAVREALEAAREALDAASYRAVELDRKAQL